MRVSEPMQSPATGGGRTESRPAANWFLGDNDTGAAMWDPDTGGAFDGLEEHGANRNQGTESTLALLSTLQHARSQLSVLQ